ncbi:MAG: GMC family oxidoreductase [Chloroflexota bacterium]|nr:GMC family oxidoreductase [Chloroflexota bacterium]
MSADYDIIIIGTGMGGGTLAYALRESGARILLIERGDYLPQEDENWSVDAVFHQKRYKPNEYWYSADGEAFQPGVHYFVGGNTKVYGAALPRLRVQDFSVLEHEGGISPAWCVSYDEYEPYYTRAEVLYSVHGESGIDPSEPPRTSPYPYPAVPNEPYMAALADKLRAQGLHPFYLPMGIDLREGGRCIRCKTCDGFPCKVHAKSDADINAVRPALNGGSIDLWTRTKARRVLTDDTGKRVIGVEIERDGVVSQARAQVIVAACGAVNSAALLLRSANAAHPNGLGNSSGLLGRNYMVHNNSAMMAFNPMQRNPTVFQKTMAVNDYYLKGDDWNYPMGNLQLLGKLQAGMLAASQPLVPKPMLREMAQRSVDWWIMSEDLPDPNNRIELMPDGGIRVHWMPNNRITHEKLIDAARTMMRRAGYPFVFIERMGIATNSHQCGTARFGVDPAASVLDSYSKAHDLANLYVMDSSFFPSSSAVNPALTIAAQALRVAEHLAARYQLAHRTEMAQKV